METLNLPDADVAYYDSFFPVENSDRLLDSLINQIQWKQNTIRFYGKESPVPRLEAWYGDPGMSYSYSGIRMDPLPWTEDLLEIKKIIEPVSMTTFNSVLINFYRDGKDRVAWHSDDEKELGKKPIIGSVSFGAERKFKLRHKKYRENGLRSDIMLKHGSFLLMSGSTQSHWAHEIPRTAKPLGPRVNLTYRKII
jgi:alkylated DNA repair dioxygenase AlkB